MDLSDSNSVKYRFKTSCFEEEWYKWQNPDCLNYHGSAFEHYWNIGTSQKRDPSPKIDMTMVHRKLAEYVDPGSHHKLILSNSLGRSFGVYRTWDDLETAQKEFHSTLETYCHKYTESAKNKYLVYVQAGKSSLHRSWYDRKKANFDLLINQYDCAGPYFKDAHYVFSQKGTKFTAIARLYDEYAELFEQYDYVFFLDDDIYIDTAGINTLFDVCSEEKLDVAQPSLTEKSHCIWDVFYRKGNSVREVNGVEIMMPIFSRDTLRNFGSEFYKSVSGFGLDLLLAKYISNINGKCGVIDQVGAKHLKPIDDKGGAYYEFMRTNLINPKSELWYLATKYKLDLEFFELEKNLSVVSKREENYAI